MQWIGKDYRKGIIKELYWYDNNFGAEIIRNEFKPHENTFQYASFVGETYCPYGEIYTNLTDPEITKRLEEIEKTFPQA